MARVRNPVATSNARPLPTDVKLPIVPQGPAGEQYKKGYALGIAAVRDEFFAALDRVRRIQVAVPQDVSCV